MLGLISTLLSLILMVLIYIAIILPRLDRIFYPIITSLLALNAIIFLVFILQMIGVIPHE